MYTRIKMPFVFFKKEAAFVPAVAQQTGDFRHGQGLIDSVIL